MPFSIYEKETCTIQHWNVKDMFLWHFIFLETTDLSSETFRTIFLTVFDLFSENCDIYHKNHDTYHKICIMKIMVHIQISRNRSKRKMKNRERIVHFDCFCVVKRPSWGAHVDPKSPLQKYITVVGKIYGGGSLVWVCSECQKKFKGSYTRVKEHLHMYKYDLKRDTRVTSKLLRHCVSL